MQKLVSPQNGQVMFKAICLLWKLNVWKESTRAGTSFLMSTEPGSDWSVNFNRRSQFVTHIEINCWNPPNEKNLWTSRKGGNPLQHSLALFKELFLFSYALVGLKRDQCNGRSPHLCLQGKCHMLWFPTVEFYSRSDMTSIWPWGLVASD